MSENKNWNEMSEIEKRECYEDYVTEIRQEQGDYAVFMSYDEFAKSK